MKRLLDQIDAALFRAADGFVLWLWDEFGVRWRDLITALTMVNLAVQLAAYSEGGTDYSAGFWWFATVMCLMSFGIVVSAHLIPVATINRSNLAHRGNLIPRALRWMLAYFIGAGIVQQNIGLIWSPTSFLIHFLILYAAIPTKPRKPRDWSWMVQPAPEGT